VPAGKREDFLSAARKNAESVDAKPGVIRFEVTSGRTQQSRFYFDEAYESEAAFAAHCQNARLAGFQKAVESYAFGLVILFKGNKVVGS
jgi:quinol monooxygenase YgiN